MGEQGFSISGHEYNGSMAPSDVHVDYGAPLDAGAACSRYKGTHRPTGIAVEVKKYELHEKAARDTMANELRRLAEVQGDRNIVVLFNAFQFQKDHVFVIV